MGLQPGQKIAHYRILDKLGEGGMGEVWRAEDTRLGRQVAIKVLPEAFVRDAARLQRLAREARLLAALKHPNISGIHGLEEADGIMALALELVEGEILAERLVRGPLSTEEAAAIALQIAEALEAAHGKGIIHRDLKPENIKFDADGRVKILDFGLARAMSAAPPGDLDDISQSPTVERTLGAANAVVGTASYMSPEQARGDEVDARTDLWALGVVLYEMLGGRKAFPGRNVTDILSSVLRDDPDWTALPEDLPQPLHRLLRRCLARDARHRLHAAGDARLELQDMLSAGPDAAPGRGRVRRPSHAMPWAIAAIAIAVAIALLVYTGSRPDREDATANRGGTVRFALSPPPGTDFATDMESHDLALSPDGSRLAFVARQDGRRGLWIRRLDSETAQLLPGTDDAFSPFWSADGEHLAFFTSEHLKTVTPATGTSEVVCDAPGAKTGSWSSDGTILFTQAFTQEKDGLYSVSMDRPQPRRILAGRSYHWPIFLPDGRRFLVHGYQQNDEEEEAWLYLGDLDSGKEQALFPFKSRFELSAGHLLYVQQGVLLARPFDLGELRFTGDPVPLAESVPDFVVTGWAPFSGALDGAVTYLSGSGKTQLAWIERGSGAVTQVGEAAPILSMALSPDGRTVALEIKEGQGSDLWLHDLAREVRARLTTGEGMESLPVWSPDGRRLVVGQHGIRPNADKGLFVMPVQGGEASLLTRGQILPYATSWSADGRWLAYWDSGESTSEDIWLQPLNGDGEAVLRIRSRAQDILPRFSPDSRWLSYCSNESGTFEVYVAAVEGAGRGVLASPGGGYLSRWRADGRELYYLAEDHSIVAVPIETVDGDIRFGEPEVAVPPNPGLRMFDVGPDHDRFLVLQSQRSERPAHVILNWAPDATER